MKNVLINFAHPARSHSKINEALKRSAENLEGVTVNDLYGNYPDFLIDVKREQQLCEDHDVIVFQHPFYWYSTPAIVKEWFDLVLEHGWAYGSEGLALDGKIVFQAISGGGDESTYQKSGYNEYTIQELTTPFRATAKLCHMNWLPPYTVLGVHRGLSDEQTNAHAQNYRRLLIGLRDETLDLEQAINLSSLNCDLASIAKKG